MSTKVWQSRVKLERIAPRSEEWVVEGYRLFLRDQEEHDEAVSWCLTSHIPCTPRSRICYGIVAGYATQDYIVIYREEDAFWVKMRWL